MLLKKILISTLVFTLVLSTIPWQAFAAQEDILALPVPQKLENNTPVILDPIVQPIEPAPVEPITEPEDKESDVESNLDINMPDKQPEVLLEDAESLLLDEPVDVPYVDKDEKKLASEQLNVDIDTNTGALVYSYPIVVPPGRNGLQPGLSLTYNNQSSNNFNHFGIGWSLNIPYIQRDGKRGTDVLYENNYFTSALSGELSPIDLTDGSHGLYGARVEDGQFLKYEYLATDNSWQVTDKQGTVYTFGVANSSRQYNPGDTSQIYKWMLAEIRDTNDNYIKYEYYQDGNDIYPYKIKYTGHDTTDGIFEVEFLRETRNDDMESYLPGFKVDTDYRIYEIQVKVDGSWVRKYELDYITGDNGQKSILDDITESGNDGANTITLPADSFTYASTTPGWTEDTNFPFEHYLYNPYLTARQYQFLDIDGDALDDVAGFLMSGDPYSMNLISYLNDGYGWNTINGQFEFPTSTESDLTFSSTRLADVNGDNLADIIIADINRDNKDVYINNGTDWELDETYNFPIYFNKLDSGNLIGNGVRLVDLNGDGLVDISQAIYCGINFCTNAWINNGHGWTQTDDWQSPIPFENQSYVFLGDQDIGVRLFDVNGDGLVDIVRSLYENGNSYKEVYINNGSGWTQDTSYNIPVYFQQTGIDNILTQMVDVNSDGLTDIVWIVSSTSNYIYLNNGHGWNTSAGYQVPSGLDYVDFFKGNFAMADVNGDGFVDILQRRATNPYGGNVTKVFLNTGHKNVIKNIKSSGGSQIDLSYKRSNQYRDASDDLLNPDLPYALETVEEITVDDGYNNDITTTYSYQGGERYYDGAYENRYAGFATVEKVTDDQKTITYFHQGNDTNSSEGENEDSYYKIGKPYRSEIHDDTSDTLFKQNLIKWEENLNQPEVQEKSMTTDPNIVSLWPMNGQAGSTEKQDNLVHWSLNVSERNNPSSVIGDDYDNDGAYYFSAASQQYVKIGDNDILDLEIGRAHV